VCVPRGVGARAAVGRGAQGWALVYKRTASWPYGRTAGGGTAVMVSHV